MQTDTPPLWPVPHWQLRAAEMASAIDENRPTAQLCRES